MYACTIQLLCTLFYESAMMVVVINSTCRIKELELSSAVTGLQLHAGDLGTRLLDLPRPNPTLFGIWERDYTTNLVTC